MNSHRIQPDHRKNERGSIVIMTAIGMLLLLLMVGLCIDVSRIYVVRAEMQNAADAAALTAADELNGGDTGIDKAVASANAIVNTQGIATKYNVGIDSVTFAVNINDDPYMEGETITMQELFQFERTGTDPNGRVIGRFRTTGIRPRFAERFKQYGMDLPVFF